jgi:integrase
MAVTKVLLPVGGMAAADFGPRALQEARQRLLTTPYTRKVRNDEGKVEVRAFPRTRRNVNEIIGRVRQMFGWAVANELVPESKAYALGKVKDLAPGESTAIDNDRRGPVADSLVDATLPFLTPEVADFVRVCRLTGSRPSEICRMTLSQIHDRDKPVWRYVPVRHKTARKGKVRHIPIGPKAQAIILAHAAGRPENDPVFTPRRSVPARITKDGTLPMAPRRASGRVGVAFTSGVIRIAVARACEKAGLTLWTPYSLRYSRTLEVREKFGAEAAKATAGHSSEQQTAHYAPPTWAAAAEAALATG